MRLFLLVASLASVAHAQPTAPRLSGGERTVVFVGSVAGGAGAMVLTASALKSDWDTELGIAAVTAGYLVGASVVMTALGPVFRAEAPFDVVVQDVVLGTAAGVAAGFLVGGAGAGAGFLIEQAVTGDAYFVGAVIGGSLGVIVGVGVAGVVTTRRLRLAPAALAAPTGERTTGLSLAISL